MKILIVDDEKDIRDLIKLYFQNMDYNFLEAKNGREALEVINDSIDLVLLDVMMPELDGIETCKKIREKYFMPIIFLTSKSQDVEKFIGFSAGADDYITKPFNPMDLTNRVKAAVRRYKKYNETLVEKEKIIEYANLLLNLKSHKLMKDNKMIKLTKLEFDILTLFLKNRGKVFSIENIYQSVWGENSILNAESTVSVHIKNLRDKIEQNPKKPCIIKTVWGVGYLVD